MAAVLFGAGNAPVEAVQQSRRQQAEHGGQGPPLHRLEHTRHPQGRGGIGGQHRIVIKADHRHILIFISHASRVPPQLFQHVHKFLR